MCIRDSSRDEFWYKYEHHIIYFPLRGGEPLPIGLLGIIVNFVLLLLIIVTVVQRKKILRNKSRDEITARADKQAS